MVILKSLSKYIKLCCVHCVPYFNHLSVCFGFYCCVICHPQFSDWKTKIVYLFLVWGRVSQPVIYVVTGGWITRDQRIQDE